jgi:hypothetical protein
MKYKFIGHFKIATESYNWGSFMKTKNLYT